MSGQALSGQTALVTGAGNGLGRAIALALGAHGCQVIAAGRSAERLAETAELLRAGGAQAHWATCDVTAPASVQALAQRFADAGVSILINNAGTGGPVAELVEIDPVDWDEVFAVDVRGTYLMCRALLPSMLAAVEEEEVAQAVIAMLSVKGLCGADIDLSAGMVAF